MRERTEKKRVVMLLSNPATYDERPLKEAHSLAKGGYSVAVLAWDRENATAEDSSFPDGVEIRRFRLFAGHGTPMLTVPRLLLFNAWCVANLIAMELDAIHCHDVDTLIAGMTAKVLRLGRAKLVYDMHDLPKAFLRFLPFSSLTQEVFLSLSARMADRVLVVNDRFVRYLERNGFAREKLVVIMNSPRLSEGRPRSRGTGEFEVLYFGWLGEERGVKVIVEAVEGLDVNLKLAGRGELEPFVRNAETKNPRVRYLGWLPMSELETLEASADLIPSLYQPRTENAKLATPGKLLKSMSLSLPSLVPEGSYQGEIVDKFGCGLVVRFGDVGQIRGSIERLSKDRALYDKMAGAAYQAFTSSFSWEVMEKRLRDAYGGLFAKSK